ncbi:TetR/AcrR family transcriptional regulator [Gordonia sp. TBRC 11910]|uniref:TetR/AcrR family transcriptional regulator n=1 Tax=Gordonia asplenii TaxID=2725283 RepID=A0A848L1F1_9ACTN|nr:TetR family transcriptional regulator [Gordonia asplenii]NMO04704.1 TetR/AcrR family transcriptional regulator [Gordonia asplenii]
MTSDVGEPTPAAPGKRRGRPRVRHELVEREIKENAARLFAERGVAGTTLQDIADATGMTRQAVYHYVTNKDELFAQLVAEIAEEPAQLLHQINAMAQLPPREKLRQMAKFIALHQMSSADKFRLMIRSEADLPEELARTYSASRRSVLKELIAVIRDGIRVGSFRETDPRTAALGIVGMLNWVAWWYHPGDDEKAAASELAEMAVQSVSADSSRAASAPSVPRLLKSMESDLGQLKRMLGGEE